MASFPSIRESYWKRDPGLAALGRALRAAIAMPVIFFFSDWLTGNAPFSLFAAFGALAMLLLVGFSGTKRERLAEAGGMIAAELFLICVGTAISRSAWLSMAVTALLTFGIYYLSILKPSLNKMATSLLISFLLPVTIPVGVSLIPARFCGWLAAGIVSLLVIVLFSPDNARDSENEITLRQIAGFVRTLPAEARRRSEQYTLRLRHAARAAIALTLAVLTASLFSVQHSLWIVLSALVVLCARVNNIGRNVAQSLIGTVIGILLASALIVVIGDNVTVCWLVLPLSVLFAGLAPVAISFTAGQTAFTILFLIISHIATPIGWKIGLIRIEDVLIGCTVSLVVGAGFWTHGTAPVKQPA